MAKQVRETSAAQSIKALVVLNKKGEHVATVQAHYSSGGTVTVDVWNHGDAACWRSLVTARQNGRITAERLEREIAAAPSYYLERESREKWAAFDLFGLQQGRASGGGYDKFAAALAGCIIDGHTIADHCGQVPEAEKARAALMRQYCKAHDAADGNRDRKFWDKRAAKIGAGFANYCAEKGRFTSLHFESGLKRLEAFGYRLIQAI